MKDLVPILLVGGLSGAFLYYSSKRNVQGFQDLVNSSVAETLDPDHVQFTRDAASRFNPLMNLLNPYKNPLHPTGTTQAQADETIKKVRTTLQNIVAKPNNPSFALSKSNTSDILLNRGSGGISQEAVAKCESITTLNCNAFDDPNFAINCGMCHQEGETSKQTKISSGGLFILEDDRLTAEEKAKSLKTKKVDYKPTIGKCAPNKFTISKEQCIRLKKQMECERDQSFDKDGCIQCYGDQKFYYVNENAAKLDPHIIIIGSGTARIIKTGMEPIQKTLGESPQKVNIPSFAEGDTLTITITATEDGSAFFAGYLEGQTISGLFSIDLFRMLQPAGSPPQYALAGFSKINSGNFNTMRPVRGQTSMTLIFLNTFTFVDTMEDDALQCASSPMLTKASSATFLNSGVCYKDKQGPGNYSLECLQDVFKGAGCLEAGTGYPSTKEKAVNLMKLGQTPAEIASKVYTTANEAYTGLRNNSKMTTQEWNTASLFCTGRRIDNPCDGENNTSGKYTPECLSFLWQNKGAEGTLGATYTNLAVTTSLSKNTNTYCTTSGTMAPIGANGQPNTSAVSTANSKGDITAIKTFYDSIHKTANNNALSDSAREVAIQQCYGISLATLPSNEIPGSTQSSVSWENVLDSSTGRTKSSMISANYNTFDWETVKNPAVELRSIGQGAWGFTSWVAGFPAGSPAKWIWKNLDGVTNGGTGAEVTFYKRYMNDTNKTITATVYASADNYTNVFINDKNITNFGGRENFTITLPPGDNKIVFKLTNASGPAGLLVDVRNGNELVFKSDNSWTW